MPESLLRTTVDVAIARQAFEAVAGLLNRVDRTTLQEHEERREVHGLLPGPGLVECSLSSALLQAPFLAQMVAYAVLATHSWRRDAALCRGAQVRDSRAPN